MELLGKLNKIKSGATHERLHLRESRDGSAAVSRWAFAKHVAIPDKGSALEYQFGWEGPAGAYVMRLLKRLKAHAQDIGGDDDNGSGPDDAVPHAGHVFVSYVHDDDAVVQRLHDEL